MKKRILAFLLTLFMLAALFPAAALAEGPAEAAESPAEEPAEAADVPEEAPAEEEAPEPEEESADEPAAETCKVDIYIDPSLDAGNAWIVEPPPYYVGQTITLKAVAYSGYTFMWWVNYETGENSHTSTYQTVLTGDCEWDAVFKKNGEYFIYINKPYDPDGVNGLKVSPDLPSFAPGTEITLTAPAMSGRSTVYEYGEDVEGSALSVEWNRIPNGGNKFSMPACDIWVRALYSANVSLSVGAGGTASLTPGPYYEDDVVTLTVTPNSGYMIDSISGIPTNYSATENTVTFTMDGTDLNISVTFKKLPSTTYNVDFVVVPIGSGTLEATASNGQITATATPLDGYHFYGWVDASGNTLSQDNPYVFTPWQDMTIYALFYVRVYVYPNIEHGTVKIENEKTLYAKGDVVTLTATPEEGYALDCFMAGELHGNSATLTKISGNSFTMPANDMVVSAKFAKLYTISASANPTAGGTVAGAGEYKDGATASLTATPKSGYDFVSWTENGSVVSTIETYSFTVSGDRTLVANFQPSSTKYTISASANPAEGGSVSGAGEYEEGKTVTLIATPNDKYNFVNWTENGSVVATSASYSFTASANRTLVANFELKPAAKYTISASANPAEGGSVSGAGEYEEGKTVTLTATPNDEYRFVNWTENATVVATSASYSFTASANRTLVANFELKPAAKYTISASANPAEGGSVSGAGEYEEGKTVTLTATPNSGYKFVNWTENGTAVSTSATYSFTASANRTLVANFKEDVVVTEYALWVGGVRVTSENAGDILGDGTAKFEGDAAKGTLTLTNANITGSAYDEETNSRGNIITGKSDMELTIVLVGTNTLSGSASGISTDNRPGTIITGSGALTATGWNTAISCYYGLVIDGPTVWAEGDYFGLWTARGATIRGGSTVTGKGSDSMGIVCGDLTVTENSTLTLEGGKYTIYSDNEPTFGLGIGIQETTPEGGEIGTYYNNVNRLIYTILVDGEPVKKAVIGPTALPGVPYVDAQGNDKEPVTQYTVVSADNRSWSTGWYVVTEDTRIDGRIGVSGDVHLILCDGATLTAVNGINVGEGNAITIWRQKGASGALTINGAGAREAGLGGNYRQNAGTITINGGNLNVTNGVYGAAIGGGEAGAGGTITINGGSVTARCQYSMGAGIGGGGSYGAGGTITINGGTVTAQGGEGGAGIGGGRYGAGGTITINGGTVTANGGRVAAGIGGGSDGAGGTITINGGTVTAKGGDAGAGIGGGNFGPGGNITINGGTVMADGGNARAIGRGRNTADADEAELLIYGEAMVTAGQNADSAKKVLAAKRVTACQENDYAKIEPCTHPNGPDNCIWCDENAEFSMVYGKSLSLKGKIALNVYLILPESVTADPDAYVIFGEEKLPVSSARTVVQGDQTCHIFTVSVKFAQLTEKYTVRLYNGEGELLPLFDKQLNDCTETGCSFCAQDYIEQVRATGEDAQLLALVNALSDLGSLAQLQFHYNEDDRVEVLGDLSAITADSVSAYAPVISSKAGTGISYYGSSLLLTDDTTIRHYFIVKGDLSQFTFKVDGKTVQPVKKGSYYYIEISNIVAKDLDKSFHVEVFSGSRVIISLDYCALSYVWKNLSKGGDDTLLSLLKALTLYNQAANAYFGS